MTRPRPGRSLLRLTWRGRGPVWFRNFTYSIGAFLYTRGW